MGLLRVLVALRHHDELLGIRRRKRAEEERVRDAEHHRGPPDPDRQHQRRRGGEARVPRQTAEAEPQIAPEVVQPPQSPRLTRRLANPSDVAEVLPRLASCLRGRAPSGDAFVRLLREMELDLVVELRFLAPPRPECTQACVDCSKRHGPSYSAGRSTLAIATDHLSHFDISRASCVRPTRVSR